MPIKSVNEEANRQNVAERPEEQNPGERKPAWPSRRTLVITEITFSGLIALFTGLQVYYGNKQWDATEKQYSAMIDANGVAKTGAEAAKVAADAAKFSNELAARNGKLQLRAYLGIEGAQIALEPQTLIATLILPIKNYGQTPASEIVSIIELAREPESEEPITILMEPEDEILTFSGPGHAENYITIFKMTAAEKANLDAAKLKFVISGAIEFRDVFDEERVLMFQLKWHRRDGRDILVWDFQADDSGLDPAELSEYHRMRAEQIRERAEKKKKPSPNTTPNPASP
jgi:hypothetical protein